MRLQLRDSVVRARLVAAIAGALLVPCGCFARQPIPAALRSRPGVELKTVADAEVVRCSDIPTSAREFWFGGSGEVKLCLYPPGRSELPMYSLLAPAPSGTIYVVKRHAYWNGIDAEDSFIEIEMPAVMADKRVIVSSANCERLLGVKLE